MTDAEELEMLELEEEEAKAAQAKPRPVFTGAPERAAEMQKLVASMNPLERAWTGLGRGGYATYLGVSDLMGRIPWNEGARVSPQVWQDQEEAAAPLTDDPLGNVGSLLAQTAAAVPVGLASGAVFGPAALGAVAPTVAPAIGALAESIIPAVASAGPGEKLDALKYGASVPAGLRLLGAVPGVAKAVGVKAAQLALGKATPEAAEEALKSGALRFGRTVEDVWQQLKGVKSAEGGAHQTLLRNLEKQGASGAEVTPVLEQLNSAAEDAALNNPGNPEIAKEYRQAAKRIQDAATRAQERGLAPPGRLALRQSEATKTGFQNRAKYGDSKTLTPKQAPINQARQHIASIIGDANEKAVSDAALMNPENAELSSLAMDFVPSKERMGRLIEATSAAAKKAKGAHRPGLLELSMGMMGSTHGGLSHGLMGSLYGPAEAAATYLLRTRGPTLLAKPAYGLGSFLERAGKSGLGTLSENLPISLAGAASRLSPQANSQTALAEALLRRHLGLAPEGGP